MAGQTGGRLVLLSSDVPDTPDYRRLTLLDATGATHREVDLDLVEPGGARPALLGGTLYFTLNSGQVRAVDPQNGRHLWDTAS